MRKTLAALSAAATRYTALVPAVLALALLGAALVMGHPQMYYD